MKIRAIVACLALYPVSVFAQNIEIVDAYAFQANPASPNGAVFMRIDNTSQSSVQLAGASSSAAKRVEIHTHEMDGDVMKMMHLDEGLEIPGGECVLFERGGYHVMLMGLTEDLSEGERVNLVLETDDGELIEVEAIVAQTVEKSAQDHECLRAEAAVKMQEAGH